MSTFQLVGLSESTFHPLFALSDEALATRGARRVFAGEDTGFPCRVSLVDARVGDELILLAFQHQPADSPYRAGGPIFVRRDARQAILQPGEVPPYVSRRLMSLRAYNAADMMIDADVVEGGDVAAKLDAMFADRAVAYIHLHNARRGCYSCLARRVPPTGD